jgi:alpha-1,2-mannosyltransferase
LAKAGRCVARRGEAMQGSRVADPGGSRRRLTATQILAAGCVLFALSAGALVAVDVVVAGGMWSMLDLHIYDWGGQIARHSGDLYGLTYQHSGLGFTYPPMAAAVFSVLAYLPLTLLKWAASVGSVAAMTAVIWLTWGALGHPRSRARLGGTLATAAVAIWAEPVQQTLSFGQVNLVLILIIVADLTLPDHVRWKGIGVGLAAGFKLTPLIFIPYLVLTRRFRAAGVATATFLATAAVSWIWLPAQSDRYWSGRLFMDAGRLGNGAYIGNQSLRGMLLRLAGSGHAAQAIWSVAVVIVAVGGLLLAAAASRRGREMAGVLLCALTGLLISPVSWSHHWVWAVPALVLAADSVLRARAEAGSRWRQRAAWGGLLALVAVFWSRLIWAVPARAVQGLGLRGPWLLTGNLYVLAGLATLGLAAMVMIRPRQGRKPQAPGHVDQDALATAASRPDLPSVRQSAAPAGDSAT